MGGCKGQQGRSKGLKVGATCNLLRALPSWRLWQPPWACGLLALFIWSGLGFWHMGPFAHNKIQEHVMLSCCIEMLIALGRAFPSLRKVSQGRRTANCQTQHHWKDTPLDGHTLRVPHCMSTYQDIQGYSIRSMASFSKRSEVLKGNSSTKITVPSNNQYSEHHDPS